MKACSTFKCFESFLVSFEATEFMKQYSLLACHVVSELKPYATYLQEEVKMGGSIGHETGHEIWKDNF